MEDDVVRPPRPQDRPAPDAEGDVVAVLQHYAATHEPDVARIRSRLDRGLGRDRARSHARPSGRARFVVPIAVAASVALLTIGIPWATARLGSEPAPDVPVASRPVPAPAVPTAPAVTTTTRPTRSVGPARPSRTTTTAAQTTRTSSPPSRRPVRPSRTAPSSPDAQPQPAPWPTPRGEVILSSTKTVSGTFDGKLRRFVGAGPLAGDAEDDLPELFLLRDGAVLRNVVIGAEPADGIHCQGTCTLENVWWERVNEDAATLRSDSADDVMTIVGGGARHAPINIVQHNGPGTVVIRDFQAQDFGKVYRACGNCRVGGPHHVVVDGLHVTAPGLAVVGINPNLGDTAVLSGIVIHADPSRRMSVCQWYQGVPSGQESRKVGEGPSDVCEYEQSDVTYAR